MIDQTVFDEMMDNEVITNVGLKSDDFESVDELMDRGLVTNVAAGKVYANAEMEMEDMIAVLDEAGLLEAIAAGEKIKLDADLTLTDYVEVKGDVTINLNGHSIVHPMDSKSKYPDVFEVMTGGKLTINGKGSVIAENGYAVYAAGDSVVTLNDGYYFSPVSAVDARKDATVTINGGEFKVDGTNNPDGDHGQVYTLNLRDKVVTSGGKDYTGDKSQIIVKGGKFYKYNPADVKSEPESTGITSFVADGYVSVADGDWFIVKKA